jgi:hypothetical protein
MGQHPSLRETIRVTKNQWIQNYFKTRIELTHDPYRVALRPSPFKVLLILSHMRSGSSLLTHLLVSNPDIVGYGETHIKYTSSQDLKKLLFRVYWRGHEFTQLKHLSHLRMNHRYVLDKLLHDSKLIEPTLLTEENIYVIFLLREPQRSLASIQDLKPHLTQAQVSDYYCQRLTSLTSYAERINNPQRSLFITHEQLIHHTDRVFDTLQRFLSLPKAFSEQYSILKTTGSKHVGDSKGNINTGKIIREARPLKFEFPDRLLTQAQQSFATASSVLAKQCLALPQPAAAHF